MGTLLEVLTTPSESVQRGVSDCLPALMKALSGDSAFVTATVETLLDRALRGAKYGDRRGAAFGLAGAVRGLGLSCLRGMGVMDALKAAIEDKSSVEAREGACVALCLGEGVRRQGWQQRGGSGRCARVVGMPPGVWGLAAGGRGRGFAGMAAPAQQALPALHPGAADSSFSLPCLPTNAHQCPPMPTNAHQPFLCRLPAGL